MRVTEETVTYSTEVPGAPQMLANGTWLVECVLCGVPFMAHLKATVNRELEEHLRDDHEPETGH